MDWKNETDLTNKTLLPTSPLFLAIISSTPSPRTGNSVKIFLDNIDKSLNELSRSWCERNCSQKICTQISFDLESNKYLRNKNFVEKNEEKSGEPWLYALSGWKGKEDQLFTKLTENKNSTSYQLIYESNTLSFKRRPYQEKMGNNKIRSQKQSRYRNNLKKPCRQYDHSIWITSDISASSPSSPSKKEMMVKDQSTLRDRLDKQYPNENGENHHRRITKTKRTSSKSSFRSDNSQTVSLTKINIDRKNHLTNNDMVIGYNSTSKLFQNHLNINSNIISKGIISMDNILARDKIQNDTNLDNLSHQVNLSMESNLTPTSSTAISNIASGTPFIYPKNIIWNSSRKNQRQTQYSQLQQQQQQINRKNELVNDVMKRNIFTTEFDKRKKRIRNPHTTKFGNNIRKEEMQHSLFSADSKHSHHFLTPLNVNSKKHF
ncbi:hypothetical protein SNEBB_008142 [Seison nebaliae]|nr:hypothetical protein SNEBB_008142 [Seison nebaliae]